MDARERVDGFDLDDHSVFNKKVDPKTSAHSATGVGQGQNHLGGGPKATAFEFEC